MSNHFKAIKGFLSSNIVVGIIVGLLSGIYSGMIVSNYMTFESKKHELLYELVMLEGFYRGNDWEAIESCQLRIRFCYNSLQNYIIKNDAEKLWKLLETEVYLRSDENDIVETLKLPPFKLKMWGNILDSLPMNKNVLLYPFISHKNKFPDI